MAPGRSEGQESRGAEGIYRFLIRAAAVVLLLSACTPFPLVKRYAASHPECLFYANATRKVAALTIDDGPDNQTTSRILDLLKKHESRATFFLISSNVRGNDSLVTRTLREGHEIANHMSRNEASLSLSPKQYEQSLLEADTVLRGFGPLRWTRPGSGRYNARMISIMRRHGYSCALGSVYPFDPQIPISGYSVRAILHQVRPGAIIILHDGGYKGRNTIKTLTRVLPELKRKGYKVVTLSELVSM
ncbi:MAG TPA: chitin deacetylase family protein [Gemmatimonadaceae bacterium]|nr:chitin deacetylase family protein [Gemmatimonadaceae bacterium]